MYARLVNFHVKPERRNEAEALLPTVAKKLADIPGLEHVTAVWNDDGTGIYAAFYEDKAAAEAAFNKATELWAGVTEYLIEPLESLERTCYDNAAVLYQK